MPYARYRKVELLVAALPPELSFTSVLGCSVWLFSIEYTSLRDQQTAGGGTAPAFLLGHSHEIVRLLSPGPCVRRFSIVRCENPGCDVGGGN